MWNIKNEEILTFEKVEPVNVRLSKLLSINIISIKNKKWKSTGRIFMFLNIVLPGKPSLSRVLDPEDRQCKAPFLCETPPDIRKRDTPPLLSLSVSNWAHSSGVSYVFHRKCKHKQRTVEDMEREERAGLALFQRDLSLTETNVYQSSHAHGLALCPEMFS